MKEFNKKINKFFKKILEIDFIKNHFKLVNIILIIIGFLLILRIISWSFRIGGGSGGFISLGLPHLNYVFKKSFYFGILFLFFGIYLLIKILKTDKKKLMLKFSFYIFLSGILVKPLLYIVAPEYNFYLTNEFEQYVDKKDKSLNFDKFFRLYKKYCEDYKYFIMIYGQDINCSGKFDFELKTSEEYIRLFEYAKENNFDVLYKITYEKMLDSGFLEKMIKDYNDKTFYAYLLLSWNNKELLDIINSTTNDMEIKEMVLYLSNELTKYNNFIINGDNKLKDDFWNKNNDYVNEKITNMVGINHKLF